MMTPDHYTWCGVNSTILTQGIWQLAKLYNHMWCE